MMSRFHIATIFTFLTFCASLGAAEFRNGSFEDGLTGWREYWFRGAAGASITVDDNQHREGAKSLSLHIPAKKSRFRLSQTVAVEPDATYRMSLWFYTKATGGDGGGNLRLGPSDAEGRHLGYFGRRTLHPTGNVWVEHEVFFHAPAEAKSVMIEFNFHGPLDGWLDAVSWEKVEPAASSELKLLFGEETPVFEELLVPGTEPKTPRMFPYWSYSGDTSHYGDMALRYGHAYDIAAEFEECATHRLAPLYRMWHERHTDLAKRWDPPVTYYPPCRHGTIKQALRAGGVPCRGEMPNPNDPALVSAFVDRIVSDNGMPRTVDRDRECFYFIFDEMFLSQTRIPKPEAQTNDYWKNADASVKEKYGFGKFGMPESTEDTDPFKWIAYLRWQADLSVKTVRTLAGAFRKKCRKAIILGPDEIATFCPHDWERMGREIDIATGQTLCAAGGSRRFNVGYLVKFHRDLTNRPVYLYVQLIKYGRSPTVETVYDWFDQLLQAGGEGAFVGAVEWFDRSLNHPKYAAPRKWQAVLDIVEQMQTLPQVRRPKDKTMAVHFGSFTQMSRRAPDQTRMGATFAMLGPRAKAWFTFTDDFQIERDTARWDEFRVVVLPDAKYADRSLCDAALRFVRRGGTLVVTDPEAFSFLLDGSDPAEFRKELFGVVRSEGEPQNRVVLNGVSLNNPDPRKLAVKVVEGENVKTRVSFGDGSPALVTHRLGKGNVWYFAFNPNTDATVYDPRWIRQWRSWLEELEVPLDQDIWRFRLPRKPLPEEPTDRCLTGNAIRFRRNVGDVSMNVDVPGGYRYDIPPQASPDCDESVGGGLIPFNKGLLANRRKMLALTGPSGKPTDKKAMALENWVVRFGPKETGENAITVDLAEPRAVSRCRLVYSGALPEITIAGSIDGDSWSSIGTIATDSTSTKAVHVAETALSGQFRYVRLAFAARKPGTTLTLAELEVWGVE